MNIKFHCKDDKYVSCDCSNLIKYSLYIQTIADIIQEHESNETQFLELSNVSSKTLDTILKICNYELKIITNIKQPLEDVISKELYDIIDNLNDDERKDILEATDFMCIESINSIILAYYAYKMKSITINDIRKIVKIDEDINQYMPWL